MQRVNGLGRLGFESVIPQSLEYLRRVRRFANKNLRSQEAERSVAIADHFLESRGEIRPLTQHSKNSPHFGFKSERAVVVTRYAVGASAHRCLAQAFDQLSRGGTVILGVVGLRIVFLAQTLFPSVGGLQRRFIAALDLALDQLLQAPLLDGP